MTPLSPAESETAARMLADPKVANMLRAVGRPLEPVLGDQEVETIRHAAVMRAARSHRPGRRSLVGSVRQHWRWEVGMALATRRGRLAGHRPAANLEGADPPGADEDEGDSPSSAHAERLAEALGLMGRHLTPRMAAAVRLRYLSNLTFADVAACLGVCESRARELVATALVRLRRAAAEAAARPEPDS